MEFKLQMPQHKMKKLPIFGDRVALVDDDDYDWAKNFKWHLKANKKSVRSSRYLSIGKTKVVTLSREVLGVFDKNKMVDHINGDIFDNRKKNLRICTNKENSRNRKSSCLNKLGVKGVRVKDGKFCAQIKVNAKEIHLGYFLNISEAAIAYDKAAIKYFGQFARLNFPNADYAFNWK